MWDCLMRKNGWGLSLLVFFLLIPGVVQSHSADTFTVVIKQSGLTPNSSQILYNDSVIWHNTDSRENITHRIVYDADGDGLYNGSEDWDSGILSSDCNSTNENESEDCKITFTVWFNGTWGIGEYKYGYLSVLHRMELFCNRRYTRDTPSVGSSLVMMKKLNKSNEKNLLITTQWKEFCSSLTLFRTWITGTYSLYYEKITTLTI